MNGLPTFIRRLGFPAAAVAIFATPALADPAALRAAMDRMDLAGVHAAAESPAERKLASVIELSWTRHDADAEAAFPAAIGMQADTRLRAGAFWELMALRARQGEFMAAVLAGEAADQIESAAPSRKQALDFYKALVGVPPTRAVTDPSGQASVRRDRAGLMRTDISVGGVTKGAILDTGANFSTMTESLAQKMGLRMLDAAVSVNSSSREAVPSRLGVAKELTIGDATFADVVFIVLPDKDLSFADGGYTIDAIIGIPVFLAMNRIAVSYANAYDRQETFAFGSAAPGVDGKRNIIFGGQSPMALVTTTVDGKASTLTLLLDSGGQQTSLEARFARDYPAILADAATVTSQRGGAGGVVTSDNTRIISRIELGIGGTTFALLNVNVEDVFNAERHGILGLDIMGRGFVVDWQKGVLELR